jgi:hypothetical protein
LLASSSRLMLVFCYLFDAAAVGVSCSSFLFSNLGAPLSPVSCASGTVFQGKGIRHTDEGVCPCRSAICSNHARFLLPVPCPISVQ